MARLVTSQFEIDSEEGESWCFNRAARVARLVTDRLSIGGRDRLRVSIGPRGWRGW